ncbi:hypothetical protein B0T10DRAFT_487084 [Thelonectria olida]|uniref:Apple domain-containing protein n=1 Tax=Thelonectria olida TaxID=1576542 RepID=A0A9P8W521_9HYPO|nr:hypothetical protein B0T10DRAFT_487084 [Thelonectria olida]
MRSVVALMALALTGTLDLVAASPCKATTTTASDLATASTTSTTTAPTSTTTPDLVVKNVCDNGNIADPGTGTGVPGYQVVGSVGVAQGAGITTDGSTETNCAKYEVSNEAPVGKKRASESVATLSQTVSNLEAGTAYTIRFSLSLVFASGTACSFKASLGSTVFYNELLQAANANWYTITKQANAQSSSEALALSVICPLGGTTIVYIDSIFMSNKVTPDTIDSVVLDYDAADSPVISSTSQATLIGGDETIFPDPVTTELPPTTTTAKTTTTRPLTRTLSAGTLAPSATCPGGVTPTPLATCVPRSPSPSSLMCGITGVKGYTWWARAKFASPNQNSVSDCAIICYQNAINCKAFAYYPDFSGGPICALGYDPLADDGVDTAASGARMTWYDLDCYKCDECAA